VGELLDGVAELRALGGELARSSSGLFSVFVNA
jgi:hypothetical protein